MHRLITMTAAVVLSMMSSVEAQERMTPASSAAERMSEAGPEQNDLMRQVGSWDVVATMWPAPGAPPKVTRAVAERSMIGPFLQEVMRPPQGGTPAFQRLDYLNFDRVEGRWKYVSMDTRFPVSIMPAWSFGAAQAGRITLRFEPLAFVGFGREVEGRFMASDLVITQPDAEHVLKEQHAIMADGTGRSWLFVRYAYTRRR